MINLDNICTSCMEGVLQNGTCTSCGCSEKTKGMHNYRFLLPRSRMKRDRYVLGQEIGCGGYGNTYIAYDILEERRIAIKECYPEYAVERNEETQQVFVKVGYEKEFEYLKKSFYQEAGIILKLSHSYADILKVYDLFYEHGTVYYTMEYLEGMDLTHYMKKYGIMSWENAAEVVENTLCSLQILHHNNLIHRDISTNNIFVKQDGGVKLLDFGSVREMTANHFTTAGSRVFSPPEIWNCFGKQGPWTDLYSLGAVLYYLLSGEFPKKCSERISAQATIGRDIYVPVKSIREDIPDQVAAVIDRSMRLEPEKRYQSVAEFASELFFIEEQKKWFLVCVEGIKKGQRFPLEKEVLIGIGRKEENTIVYRNGTPWISGKHCTVFLDEDDQVYVRDEESKNHTYINDYQLDVREWYLLRPNDVLKFTSEEYILEEVENPRN